MADFSGLKMTNDGVALQAKSLTGIPLPFTRVAIGDGYLPDGVELQDLTALVHEIESLDIVELVNLGEGKVRLQARVTNEGRVEGFYIREIGIFANDPDNGEILYAVTNAGDRADYLPEEGGGIIEEILNLITIVGNAEHVTATIDSASAATVQQVQELDARVTTLESDLAKDAATIPYNIQRGQNIVDAVQDSGVRLKSIKGRTDINHVPLFDSGLWSLHANAVMNSPTKITHTNISGNVELSLIFIPATSKTMTLSLRTSGSPVVSVRSVDANLAIIVTHFSEVVGEYATVTFTNDAAAKFIRIDLATVSAGTYTFEDIMLAEGSEGRPFVANMKPLGTVMIENKGKNLLKTKPDNIDLSGSVVQNDQYDLTLNATGTGQGMTFLVPAMPNQQYYFRIAEHGARTYIISIDKDGTETFLQTTTSTTQYSVIAPSNSVTLKVGFTSGTVGAGTYNFKNYILSLEDTPFEPHNPSRITIPEVGRSSADGTVCDEVYERDGMLWRLQKFGYKVLDGSLNWEYNADYAGFKRVRIPNFLSYDPSNSCAIKYNGVILVSGNTADDKDRYSISSGALFITIADTDSGWPEGWSSLSQYAVQAYFNGWIYTGTTDQSTLEWTSIYDSNVKETSPINAAQRNLHAENGKVGYQLQYQLAQPVEVEIADIGGLALHRGLNQVELSEGVVLGEPVTPVYYSGNSTYRINNESPSDSKFQHRTDRILTIYRNGEDDTDRWQILDSGSATIHGNEWAQINATDYDSTATYSVDYIALDKYLLTTNVTEADLEGQANLATAVGKNVRDIADFKRSVDVIERDYARKQQMAPVYPTLLNGWTTGSVPVKYYVDEFGVLRFQGLITNGMLGQPALILPSHLWPKASRSWLCAVTGTNTNGAKVVISAAGVLTIEASTTASIYLDAISYHPGY